MAVVPAPVVLTLAVLSFFLGRFQQQSSELPELSPSVKVETDSNVIVPREELAESRLLSSVEKMISPADMETYVLERSGLSSTRPPVATGATGNSFYSVIPFQYLSLYPRLVVYPNFIDEERCNYIIKLATNSLQKSGLAYRPGEVGSDDQQTRTSQGTFLMSDQDTDGVLAWVEEKIASVTFLPVEHGEAFNVLKYNNMQHYDSHMDSFDPKDFGPQPSQRVATVLLYLSDVEAGGETVFKHQGKDGESRQIQDWRNCEGDFKYKPRRGDAVLFWSVKPWLEIDPHALHGGCPVIAGTKWVATKWLRNKPQRMPLSR